MVNTVLPKYVHQIVLLLVLVHVLEFLLKVYVIVLFNVRDRLVRSPAFQISALFKLDSAAATVNSAQRDTAIKVVAVKKLR